jgi:hypothetical protein
MYHAPVYTVDLSPIEGKPFKVIVYSVKVALRCEICGHEHAFYCSDTGKMPAGAEICWICEKAKDKERRDKISKSIFGDDL